MQHPLKAYLSQATKEQADRFAAEAGTTVGYLRLIRAGARHASTDLALRLEKASEKFVTEGLPPLFREDFSDACANCEFAKAHRSECTSAHSLL